MQQVHKAVSELQAPVASQVRPAQPVPQGLMAQLALQVRKVALVALLAQLVLLDLAAQLVL